jgi:S-adenosylmethionine hydrolase
MLAVERLEGIDKAVEISADSPETTACPTFHGRDVFSPAAAHLLLGKRAEDFGPALAPHKLAKKPWDDPSVQADKIVGEIIDIDRFGTLRSNIAGDLLDKNLSLDTTVNTVWGRRVHRALFGRTFSDVAEGEELFLVDSSGFFSLAINCGNAVEKLGYRVGDQVVIYRETR